MSRVSLAFLFLTICGFVTNVINWSEFTKDVEYCASKHQQCLKETHDSNEVNCQQSYSECIDKIGIPGLRAERYEPHDSEKKFLEFLAETEEFVKRAEANRRQELLDERIKFITKTLSPLVSHLLKSKQPFLKFDRKFVQFTSGTLQGTPEDLLWLTNTTRLQNPGSENPKNLIRSVEENFVNKILTTPFNIWYGGVGGVTGKLFDRVFVAILCPSSEKKINQAYAEHADGWDLQAGNNMVDRKLVDELMKIANNSGEIVTCKLYASTVQASLNLIGKKSYGLRTKPLTDQMIRRDQELGTAYQHNQDGLLELPDEQKRLYEFPSIKRQASACQDSRSQCHKSMNKKPEECEAEFVKCHNEIETTDPELSLLLGQTIGFQFAVWMVFEGLPKSLIEIVYPILMIIKDIRDSVVAFYALYQAYEWIQEILAENSTTPPTAAENSIGDQPKPPSENLPIAQTGNNNNLAPGEAVATEESVPTIPLDDTNNNRNDGAEPDQGGREEANANEADEGTPMIGQE